MSVAAPTSATDRFKGYFADAWERICVLEAELAKAQARVAALEAEADERSTLPLTRAAVIDRDGLRKDTRRPGQPCP